jgi:ribosomal protein S6
MDSKGVLNLNTVEETVVTKLEEVKAKVEEVKAKIEEKVEEVKAKVEEVKVLAYDVFAFLKELFNINPVSGSSDKLNELKIKLNFQIPDKVVDLIKLIGRESPDTFNAISKTLSDVLKDGVLDMSDVPKFVLLVSALHNTELKKLSSPITVETVVDFIKFLMHAIVELDFIKVNNKEKVFEMLDTSILLLTTTLNVQMPAISVTGCFGCFGKK